jgi:predicted transcriptional regulator
MSSGGAKAMTTSTSAPNNNTITTIMTPTCSWVSPETSVADAAKMMRDQDIGFLPVAENDRLIGTLTDRDIVIRMVAARRDPTEIPVRDAMTKKIYYCFDDQDIDAVTQNMAAMQVRRLPVVNRQKRLVGTISFADLARTATPTVFTNAFKQITTKSTKTAIKAANVA